MESNNKGTIYQQLNSYFYGIDNTINGTAIQQPQQPQKIIIKGNTPEEIRQKGLELQQKQDLLSKFNKTTDRSYQKALQYEAARLPAYMDYEGMEFFPLISSALDLFMEEATTIGSNGKMLNIYSNNERIKVALEDLFYNTIKINVNLPFWTRNLAKYGDNFCLIYGERKQGITHVKQMVNYEIERIERIENGKPTTKFKDRLTGSEFNIFEVAHFRLLGDDKFIPYGSSILNKVRRVFRQLCLDSNSIIWTENGYKKIKDLTLDDIIYSYDYNNNKVIKTKIKNIYKTGEKNRIKLKTRHREIILTEDHPVLIKNIKNEFEYKNVSNILHNDKLILPTINDNINDSFKIKLNSNYYHVILNDEGKKKISEISSKNIMKTLNDFGCKTSIKNLHSFIKGYNRSILYNDYLKIMNYFNLTLDDVDLHYFNSRKKAIVNKNLEFTVDDKFIKLFGFMLGDGWINYPNNTVGFALGVYENENEYYLNLFKNLGEFNYRINPPKKNTGGQINFQSTELLKIFEALDFKTGCFNKIIPNWVYDLSYDNKISFINGIFDADGCDSNHLYSSSNHELIKSLRVLAQTCNIQVGNIIKTKTNNKFQDKIVNRKDSYCLYINHNKNEFSSYQEEKITSTEIMGIGEVWDIEVDNDLHNFIADGIVVHNCMAEDSMLTNRLLRAGDKRVFKIDVGNIDEEDVEEYMYKVATKFKRTPQVAPNDGQIDYRFNILGNDEDYFLPLRNGNSLTGIDTLQGSSTLDAIHDIEYLRDNLFIGLGIPKPFLSFQDASGAGKNMAQFDVRFAKKVIRLQQAMIEELNKMAIIHLMLLGFSESDIRDFQLTLTNPSIQHDLLKSELLREQAQTYTELTRGENGIAAMSHTRAKRLVFNMSDVDIVEDLKQQKMEKVVMQELADAPVLIKKSGLFADIDKKFGNETALIGAASGETTQGGEMPTFSPGGGPMNEPPMGGGEMGGAPTSPANGGAPSAPTGGNELPPISEHFTNYIHKLVGLNIKENNISTIAAATDIILENEKINNITFNLLKETNNIAEQDDIDINEINID